MRRTPLDRLDEACLNLGSADEPWTVHLEARVEGRIDEQRLREAIRAAMQTHPIARARIKPWKWTAIRYFWLIPDEPRQPPLIVVDCRSEDDVNRARNALVSRAPDLEHTGTFEILLARTNGGDHLILNVHHAAGDGIAALRLLRSIIRNYAGLPDPVPDFDPIAARNVRKLVGSRGIKDRGMRSAAVARHLAVSTRRPARVAVDNGHPGGGYGCVLIPFTSDEVEQAASARPEGATVNDLLLGALALTIRRWNDEHDIKPGRISITMPVNIRPKEWSTEVFGNFASYVTVQVMKDEQADLSTATSAAHRRTTRIKKHRAHGIIVDALKLRMFVPAGMKRVLNTKPIIGDLAVDTTWLTNLGKVEPLEDFGGDAGAVSSLWLSAPGTMPMGATVGVISHGSEMYAALRYRHPQFDAPAAERFSQMFRETLLKP